MKFVKYFVMLFGVLIFCTSYEVTWNDLEMGIHNEYFFWWKLIGEIQWIWSSHQWIWWFHISMMHLELEILSWTEILEKPFCFQCESLSSHLLVCNKFTRFLRKETLSNAVILKTECRNLTGNFTRHVYHNFPQVKNILLCVVHSHYVYRNFKDVQKTTVCTKLAKNNKRITRQLEW